MNLRPRWAFEVLPLPPPQIRELKEAYPRQPLSNPTITRNPEPEHKKPGPKLQTDDPAGTPKCWVLGMLSSIQTYSQKVPTLTCPRLSSSTGVMKRM